MEPDPIAENQTDVTVATLMSRSDGDPLMNKAVASLLAYSKKLGAEMAEIKKSLWTLDALDKRISEKHSGECRECTIRKWVEDHKKQIEDTVKTGKITSTKPSLLSFLMSERGLLVIVVLILTLAFVRQSLGREGYRDVTGSLSRSDAEVRK